jgi:hypothetical protein
MLWMAVELLVAQGLNLKNIARRGLGRAQRLPHVAFGLLVFSSFLVLGLNVGCWRLEGGICVISLQILELEYFMDFFQDRHSHLARYLHVLPPRSLRGDAMDRDFMPYQRVWLVQTCVT